MSYEVNGVKSETTNWRAQTKKEHKGLIGHVLENVWKTIVYCSILENVYKELEAKPIYIDHTKEEQNLQNFVISHYNLIVCSFEKKLEIACDWLDESAYNVDNFSKKIHDKFLIPAKAVLLPILRGKNRIVILIDNLDKVWSVNSNLYMQAQLLFNLLGIHRRIHNDFDFEDVSVLIFMRRNIFEYIKENFARESDKLIAEAIELQWVDKDVLLRVIEERFRIATNYWNKEDDNPWESFFKWNSTGISLKDWLYKSLMPRPRDLIKFIQKAIEVAISRKHSEIQQEDLEYTLLSYSSFALEQIIAEYKAEQPWLSDLLFSFTGEFKEITYDQLIKKIKESSKENLSIDEILQRVVVLVNINFLGVKINGSPLSYAYTIADSNKLTSLVMNIRLKRKIKFVIHPAFSCHLHIIEEMPKTKISKLIDLLSTKFLNSSQPGRQHISGL